MLRESQLAAGKVVKRFHDDGGDDSAKCSINHQA
jgi:hypothetical protein